MKKFYTLLAIGLGIAVSAVAAPNVKSTLVNPIQKSEVTFAKTQKLTTDKINPTTFDKNITSIEDLAGEYDWSFEDGITQGSVPLTVNISVTDAATGACTIKFENSQYGMVWNVNATADIAAGTFTIPNDQYVGADQDGDLYFYLKDVNAQGNLVSGKSADANVVGTISGSTITFPEMSIWVIGDYNNESLGFYIVTYYNVFENVEQDADFDPNEGWTNVGNAQLQDGWLVPCFGGDQTASVYSVPLQRNNAKPTTFRLVDPYKCAGFPYADQNSSSKVGYIQFDIADPDHVLFDAVEAGFANSQLAVSKFYCLNYLGFAVGYLNKTVEEILANPELVEMIIMTKYRNGVVELTSVMGDEGWENDACFGIQGNIYGGYGWVDGNQNPINMAAKITLPAEVVGISDVIEDSNAPVEYYNLQGMRVINPEKGQIVIARQGSKAEKYIVK